MAPALKARVIANLAKRASDTAQVVPRFQAEPITSIEAESIPPNEAESIPSTEAVQPSEPTLTNGPSDNRQPPPGPERSDSDMSDALSYTSSLPDVFDVGSDDSAPLATGPWTIVDHFTGEMIVDDDEVPPAVLGTPALTLTPPPTLLFAEQDVRPDWLVWSTSKFLRHVPYYMALSNVVDLFLAQEARLGYPAKASQLFFSCLHSLMNLFTNHQSIRTALPSRNRPTEIAAFMKYARDFRRGNSVDPETFGAKVLGWWITIQPTTRKAWPPSHEQPSADLSFDYFKRGGPNGTFLMILCLSWWASALDINTDLTNFRLVVDDVRWVFEQIASRA